MVEKRRSNWRKWGKSIRKIIIMTGLLYSEIQHSKNFFFNEKRLGLKAGCPKIKTTVNIEKLYGLNWELEQSETVH